MPTDLVVTQAPGYMLRVPERTFDVDRFESMVAEACRARAGR